MDVISSVYYFLILYSISYIIYSKFCSVLCYYMAGLINQLFRGSTCLFLVEKVD